MWGAGNASSKPPNARCVLSREKIDRFLRVLCGYTQRTAFGTQLWERCGGDMVELSRLIRTQSLDDVYGAYIKSVVEELNAELLPASRCKHTGTRNYSFVQCFKPAGHAGQHSWTPPGGIGPGA